MKSLQLMNGMFLLKLLWKMEVEPTCQWVQVLLGKYGRESSGGRELVAKKVDTKLLKDLAISGQEYIDNVQRVGDNIGNTNLIL